MSFSVEWRRLQRQARFDAGRATGGGRVGGVVVLPTSPATLEFCRGTPAMPASVPHENAKCPQARASSMPARTAEEAFARMRQVEDMQGVMPRP